MKKILLIGGTGFVGTAVAAELMRRNLYGSPPALRPPRPTTTDFRLCLPTRRRDNARHLALLPTADVVQADVHDPATLLRLMADCEAVISLVGILHGDEPRGGAPYGQAFARAHVELPKKIAAAAKQLGVRRVVHVSGLGAATEAPSCYLRSKAAGEAALQQAEIDLTIFRPSVIFGQGDSFLTLFAQLAKIAPFFPLAGADVKFQPIWVNDVAACVVDALTHDESIGQIYELGGPRVYALRELVAFATAMAGHPRTVIGLPDFIATVQARFMELLPEPPMTRDNLRSMKIPSTTASPLPFGRVATALEAVAPGYL